MIEYHGRTCVANTVTGLPFSKTQGVPPGHHHLLNKVSALQIAYVTKYNMQSLELWKYRKWE
jgi:hypothetical protein